MAASTGAWKTEEFFGEENGFLEARVKLLYGDGNIISQYVAFIKVYQEQARQTRRLFRGRLLFILGQTGLPS